MLISSVDLSKGKQKSMFEAIFDCLLSAYLNVFFEGNAEKAGFSLLEIYVHVKKD
jgi:hypothetical protein